MKKLILLPSIIAGAFFINSCTTQTYVSNAVNAPLLKEKGEIHVAATGKDLQVAVAVTKNLGVMANGYYQNYKSENNYQHNGMMGEAAIGYYKPINSYFTYEAFVGGGVGKVHKQEQFIDQNDNAYMASFNANAAKLFIQPDIGFKTKFIDVALSSRFSFVKYSNFRQSNYTQQQLSDNNLNNNDLTNPLFAFAEPAITIRGGYKFIKLQFQYGLTINLTPNPIKHPDNFSSLGLIFNIGQWYNN